MGPPGRRSLSHLPLPKPVPSLFQRLRERLPGQRRTGRTVVEERPQDPLLLAGQQLREAR